MCHIESQAGDSSPCLSVLNPDKMKKKITITAAGRSSQSSVKMLTKHQERGENHVDHRKCVQCQSADTLSHALAGTRTTKLAIDCLI